MPSNQEIQKTLAEMISRDILDESSIDLEPSENLLTSGLIDSMGAMRLVNLISERYDLEIPPKDRIPANFMTIEVLASYLKENHPIQDGPY